MVMGMNAISNGGIQLVFALDLIEADVHGLPSDTKEVTNEIRNNYKRLTWVL